MRPQGESSRSKGSCTSGIDVIPVDSIGSDEGAKRAGTGRDRNDGKLGSVIDLAIISHCSTSVSIRQGPRHEAGDACQPEQPSIALLMEAHMLADIGRSYNVSGSTISRLSP
jgi:hypothetical protein